MPPASAPPDRGTPPSRRWPWLAGIYAALLLTSWAVRQARGPLEDPTPGGPGAVVQLQAVAAGQLQPGVPVRLAYSDLPGPDRRTPVVLVHGSPGTRRELLRVGALLSSERRVLVPDLPGFGASTRSLPDYSFAAHAHYLRQWLDALGIHRVHVVGYSMGGGVALSLAALAPHRLASVTLLSAIGAQEFELVGDYDVNHAVHGLQLAAIRTLQVATPHMGVLDRLMLDGSYARNFYDSDQRPLRGILATIAMPVLILHGTRDPLVPYDAAREHARLVPQSELVTFDDDHFMPFMQPDVLVAPLADFLARVDAGRGVTRATADPDRGRAAADGPPIPPPRVAGIGAVVLAGLLAASTLVSEDLACLGAGMLVAHGRIGFGWAVAGCFLGILFGDVAVFLAGRWVGRTAAGRTLLNRLIGADRLTRAVAWLTTQGPYVAITSRFLPGTRLPTYVGAGLAGADPWRYLGCFALACAVWTPLLVGAAALPTAGLSAAGFPLGGRFAPLLLLLLFGALLRIGLAVAIYRRRRALVGWWRRWTRWEFWPMWLFYPPIVVYVAWLGLRHRGMTVFTACNPGMPGGGFVGESKSDILRRIAAGSDVVPAFTLVTAATPAEARRAMASDHAAAHGYPVVVKPDQGQRGAGVTIARTSEALARAMDDTSVDTILQRYVTGDEFGVFYYRRPGEPSGRIFAITTKRLAHVVGDGRRTLERLILDDDRAVAIAPLYCRLNAERLASIPAAGERVHLSELGVHSRGAIFLDGGGLETPALAAAVDGVGRAVQGFYFGRFDVRADSADAFSQGRFQVIELNGVTSEATSIYDPAHTLLDAYRTLFAQWRLAFEIGAANRARGVPVTSLRDLAAHVFAYRSFAKGHLGR